MPWLAFKLRFEMGSLPEYMQSLRHSEGLECHSNLYSIQRTIQNFSLCSLDSSVSNDT